jgi:gliding motility-associated-like protein
MKKYPPILILLLLFSFNSIKAQDFFICTGSSTLRKVQLPLCSSQLKANLGRIFNDITFHPSGKLYGITQGSGLYEIDTVTGQTLFIINMGLGTLRANFNALTANAEGTIFAAADNGKLTSYNPQIGVVNNLGTIQVNGVQVVSAGDLTFYRGELYIASTRTLVKINLNDPANSSIFMNFNVPNEIFGIVSFVECGLVSTYATTGDAAGIVYKIDWANRSLINICRTSQTIYGGASLYEFKASTVSLDTTRIVNYTCDKTQANVLPMRTLRNQLGCDSVVFERTDYVKPDTLLNASVTCERSKVRADTARLRNVRGCDSLVITSVKLGTDSISSAKQICLGDSVVFYNQWLKQTGNYSKNFAKASGCDSVITLNLTVFDKNTTLKDTFVCQQNKVKLDTAFLKSTFGCDSFSIRNQLIAPRLSDNLSLNKRICAGDFVSIGQNRFYTEGSFKVVLKNIYGCDSTVNLALKLVKSDTVIFRSETCEATKIKDSIRVFKNQFGCDSSVFIKPKLIANTNTVSGLPKDIKLVIGDSVELMPRLNFTPNLIQWTPPNLVSCPTCTTVFSRVRRSTILQFYAKDEKDCAIRQEIKFLVDLNRRVFIPNSFSPNNDRVNDIFTLYGDGNLQLIESLKVFDRWGELVFSGTNLSPNSEGWDGQFKGQILPPDVFVFWAKLTFKDGETELFKGEINLVK